jgi:signal transduction histidine kinase/DNA-binding response OmpR family regulator
MDPALASEPEPTAPDARAARLARDLADAIEQQAATSEVLETIGRSAFELQPVFDTVVRHAVRLCDADAGLVYQLEGDDVYRLAMALGGSEEYRRYLAEHPVPRGPGSLVRLVELERRTVHIPDARSDPRYQWQEARELGGFRTMLGVPMLAEDRVVGVICLWRGEVDEFDERTIGLVTTFAAQGAIAIQNVQLFQALEERSRQLEVASRHKSEFLASMSHELRTPLNAVIGFSDVLLDRMFGDLNDRQEEYVRDIRDSGRHLLELINEILDLSKIEAGRMELELGPVSLPELLEHGVAMVRERAAQHGLALDLEVAPEVGTVRGDELKLKQVVLNLLSNAVKFTPDGGRVDVTARVDGGDAVVSVRDTGVGIPDEERDRIFEAFQRGGRGARTGTEGTGLGLTLSRRIVDLHGGRLWMESRVGEGSTFSFSVPRAEPPLPAHAQVPAAGAATARLEPGSILVVEDDRRSADLLRLYLEGAGFRVVVAADGAEGLELARRIEPTAVILDVLLPRVSGWDVLAWLKRDPATAAIPVVIVSMLDERGAGFALGAAEYLVKPVDHDELLRAVTHCVAPPGGRTVVAIDDEPLDLDLVEAALAPHGWSVLRAQAGEEGVELVRRERPDVVLLDLLMPEMDGFAVVEALRADPDVAGVPIVVLTSKDMTAADRERLHGRISLLAQKGTFRQDQLADVLARLSAAPGAGP